MFDSTGNTGMKRVQLICLFENNTEHFVSNASYITIFSAKFRQWAGCAPLTIMATVPALPVIILPLSICPALQVLYTHMPALCLGIWAMPDQRDSGHGFPWSGRRAAAAHMAKAWQGDEREEGEAGGYQGLLVPL